MQNSKMAVWGGLQIAVKRREVKAKEKKKDIPFECRVPNNSKER